MAKLELNETKDIPKDAKLLACRVYLRFLTSDGEQCDLCLKPVVILKKDEDLNNEE